MARQLCFGSTPPPPPPSLRLWFGLSELVNANAKSQTPSETYSTLPARMVNGRDTDRADAGRQIAAILAAAYVRRLWCKISGVGEDGKMSRFVPVEELFAGRHFEA